MIRKVAKHRIGYFWMLELFTNSSVYPLYNRRIWGARSGAPLLPKYRHVRLIEPCVLRPEAQIFFGNSLNPLEMSHYLLNKGQLLFVLNRRKCFQCQYELQSSILEFHKVCKEHEIIFN